VGSEAFLRVRDTGLGIPNDQIEEIFNMFSQVPEHRARIGGGGLGIGLALARQLITMHGGSIEAKSEGLGRGSEFAVRLPLSRDAAPEPLPKPVRVTAGSMRVLIVDDNVDAAESLGMALGLRGHVVRTAHNGSEALEAVKTFEPNAVLLDIGLPRMDGYEVARRLRAMPAVHPLFLVAVTGWGQPEDKARAKEAGFDEHLTKPVDVAVLAGLLESATRPRA
jgi:CheY-like chemotaxis protein